VENFSANLFFKVTETGVFRKQLPSGTFVFRYEKSPSGFSSTKDHLSSNTAGDCRLQLLIVHHPVVPYTVCGYTGYVSESGDFKNVMESKCFHLFSFNTYEHNVYSKELRSFSISIQPI
jgi:hypothetical protein